MKKTYKIAGIISFLGIFLAANAYAKGTALTGWWEANQVNVSLVISLVALIISLYILLNTKRRRK